MAEPLYNTYRPQNFGEVIGQTKIVDALKQRAKEDNFPRTILLCGSTGTGKSTMEKIISKTILCENKDESGNPCNECTTCKAVIYEKISASYYLKNASNLGIDEMRELEQTATMVDLGVKKKVIVIDEFQEIASNQKASKNILKILEKQSKYTHFILCAMDTSKINKAIKDRCVTYNLKPLDYAEIGEYLYKICEKQNIEITDEKAEVLLTIADSSGGSMRGAISMLERCIDSDIWTVKEAIEELKIVSNQNLIEIMNKLLLGDIKCIETKITKDILDRLRYVLNLFFKHISGHVLNSFEKQQIQSIDKSITLPHIVITYEELNKLFFYPYQPQDIIEYTLIRVVQRIQEYKESFRIKKEEPVVKRRR